MDAAHAHGTSTRAPIVLVAVAVVAVALLVLAGGAGIRRGAAVTSAASAAQLAAVDAAGHLSTLDGRGAELADLGRADVRYQFPAWSPDGTRIAALATGPDAGIHVFDVAARPGARPVIPYADADRPPFYLQWSPDGARIAFLTTESDGIALRVAPADASSPAEIVREGEPLYWDWAGAERLLVHVGNDRPDGFLGEVGLDGATAEPEPLTAGVFRSPAVAPSGGHRAWVGRVEGEQAVVIESADRSVRHVVPAAGNVAVGFDPAGERLALISARQAAAPPTVLPLGPLRLVEVASGRVTTLVDDDVLAWSWSPDGETLAVLLVARNPLGPDEARVGGVRLAMTRPAAVAPPGIGIRLAFVEAATGATIAERNVRVSELFAFQVLPYFDQYGLSHRFWSADGAWFALPLAGDDAEHLVAIPPHDGAAVTLGDAVFGSWRP